MNKRNKRIAAITVTAVTVMFVAAAVVCGCLYARTLVADEYYISSEQEFSIADRPISIEVEGVIATDTGDGGAKYEGEARLFGIVPLKKVRLTLVEEKQVVVAGDAFGVKMYTNGLMVVGFTDIETASSPVSPARDAGIKKGDIIKSVNGIEVTENGDIIDALQEAGGGGITVEIERDGNLTELVLTPVFSESEQRYKVGMWLRDSAAGIGTLTFYDPSTLLFTGLGHGIYDADTTALMPVKHGEIVRATITNIKKGERGSPGELRGVFESDAVIGELYGNSELGVYGKLNTAVFSSSRIKIGLKQDIEVGEATIISPKIGGGTAEYKIRITRISNDSTGSGKNMDIRVIDEELLELTGGIVQGMSGSPIIQNGRLIGAVTHVLVGDPTSGYAIFAEKMYDLIDVDAQ